MKVKILTVIVVLGFCCAAVTFSATLDKNSVHPVSPNLVKIIEITPAAPSDLTGSAAGVIQINLTWKDNSTNETGFKIERREADGPFLEIKTTDANVISYSDQTVKFKTSYTYRIRAFNNNGFSAYSAEFKIMTPDPPPANPSSLTAAIVSATQVELHWKDNSNNETGFKIERKPAQGQYVEIGSTGANAASYSDKTVSPATTYFYHIRSYNNTGNSLYSNEVTAYVPAPPPIAPPASPGNLTATTPLYGQVALSWQDNSNCEAGFKIERHATVGNFVEIAHTEPNITTYLDKLQVIDTYYYRITAYNNLGNSAYSNEIWVTPGNPAKPTNLTATIVGGAQIKLTWQISPSQIDGYKITRAGADMLFKVIATIGPTDPIYLDNNPNEGELYRYYIQSYNSFGDSGISNTVVAGVPPAAPSNLTATALSPYAIKLIWHDNSNWEDNFKIERSTDGSPFQMVATMSKNTIVYTDVLLTPNTLYTYRIIAIGYNGNSGYSNEVTLKSLP